MEKIVTIIVPVYNEIFLSRCIESCLKQSMKEIEILLLIENVSKNTTKLINYYKKLDNRISIVFIKNKMKENLKNVGIENASGNYITFINQTDYLDIDFVKDHLYYLKKYKCDIVASDYCNDEDKFKKENIDYIVYDEVMKNYLLMNIRSSHEAKLFKKRLFNDIYFPATNFDDFQTMYKVYDKCKKIVKLNIREYFKEDNEIVLNDSEYMKKMNYCIEMLNFIENNYKELLPYCKTKICCESIYLMQKVNDKNYKKLLYEYVKLYRRYAIKDKRLPKNVRFTVMKSILGFNMLNIYLNLENK